MNINSEKIHEELTNYPVQPGCILQELREQKGLTQQEIAQSLNLPIRFVASIEEGQFDVLPGNAFARGYIRSYAKLLGLDNVDELIGLFDQYTGTKATAHDIKLTLPINEVKPLSKRIYWIIGIILVLIVILGICFGWQGYRANGVSNETAAIADHPIVVEPTNTSVTLHELPLQVTSPESSTDKPTAHTSESLATSTEANQNQMMPTSENVSPEAKNQPVEEPSGTLSTVNEGDKNRIQISVTGNCWITITDHTGKIIINRLATKNMPIDTTGTPPFELLLGIPQVATIMYEGKPVTINAKPGIPYRMTLGQ